MKLHLNPISILQSYQQSDFFSAPKIRNKLGDLCLAMIQSLPGGFSLEQSHYISLYSASPDADPSQTTSIKVSSVVRCSWTSNSPSFSPRKLNLLLDEFEQEENLRKKSWLNSIYSPLTAFERSESLRNKAALDLPTARSLVMRTADVYEAIHAFSKEMLDIKKALEQQSQSANFDEELSIIKNLLDEITKITLPKELTPASVAAYEKKAIEFCQKQIAQLRLLPQINGQWT